MRYLFLRYLIKWCLIQVRTLIETHYSVLQMTLLISVTLNMGWVLIIIHTIILYVSSVIAVRINALNVQNIWSLELCKCFCRCLIFFSATCYSWNKQLKSTWVLLHTCGLVVSVTWWSLVNVKTWFISAVGCLTLNSFYLIKLIETI